MASPAPPKQQALSFANIRCGPSSAVGQFRILDRMFGWKDARGGVQTFNAGEVTDVEWQRVSARDYALSVVLRGGKRVTFTGFRESDYEPLTQYVKKHWHHTATTVRIDTKGWHWGKMRLGEKEFCVDIDDRRAIEIPFSRLANATSLKSDMAIEIEPSENAPPSDDHTVEIRFCVPVPQDGDAAEIAAQMKDEILVRAGLGGGARESLIVNFSYKQCQMPPGRFDVMFYENLVKLHGKSSDFSIYFQNIRHFYLLPSPLGPYHYLILELETPLRKGQTKYPAVIIQLENRKEIDVELTIKELVEKVEELRMGTATYLEHELAANLLRALTGKTAVPPSDFKGSTEFPCFRCSHKVTAGVFYPLEKAFLWIPKPVIIVPYREVAYVDFGRVQGSQTRLFDFALTLTNGSVQEFTSVDRQDLQPFMDFVVSKNIKYRHRALQEDRGDMDEEEDIDEETQGMLEGSDSEDQDFEDEGEESEEEEEDEGDED